MTSRPARKPQRKAAKRKSSKLAAKPKRGVKVSKLQWQDVLLEISYERDWMGREDGLAHLEIQVLSPKGASIPLTETSYRSHITARHYIEDDGGPVAYVRAWLDAEAAKPAWKKRELASRQLSLF
jgi:hypothetical protein